MIKNLLVFTTIFFFNCSNNEAKFHEDLVISILEVYDLNTNSKNNILVITETDCNSCFDRIKQINESNVKGLFYAKDSLAFKNMLFKVNRNIEWVSLPNRNISNMIENNKKNVGPYMITINNDVINCEKF